MVNENEKKEEGKSWLDLTNEEVIERIFGKEVVDAVKKLFGNDEDENNEPSIPQ